VTTAPPSTPKCCATFELRWDWTGDGDVTHHSPVNKRASTTPPPLPLPQHPAHIAHSHRVYFGKFHNHARVHCCCTREHGPPAMLANLDEVQDVARTTAER
jgi:hypothetical protein